MDKNVTQKLIESHLVEGRMTHPLMPALGEGQTNTR